MKREWTDLEFTDWILLPSEAALLANKTGPTRLGFAVLLKFFQYAARFPLSEPCSQLHEALGDVAVNMPVGPLGRDLRFHEAEHIAVTWPL